MAEVWFTADTHFGHELISKLRGFRNVLDMDKELIINWNKWVKPGDVVYHLGDFMLPQNQERCEWLLRNLNGSKQLIIGNHERPPVLRAKGWAWVGDYKRKKINSQHITMFHYAMRTWQGIHHGEWHLYGHSHGMLTPFGKSLDVGIDTNPDFRPYSFDEVEYFMSLIQTVSLETHRQPELCLACGDVPPGHRSWCPTYAGEDA